MAQLAKRIAQGRGDVPADLVLKNGTVFDVVTGAMIPGDVAICGDTVVGIAAEYSGKTEVDMRGLTLVPGFIDTHLHIESSLVTPFEFDRLVTPLGVTTAICDPHEIANVLGLDGIRYFLDAALETVLDIRVNLSSCVPSSPMETAGARIEAEDLLPLCAHPKVIGLAEMMNFPGVLNQDPVIVAKLNAFEGAHIDGHAPMLSGRDLNAYIAAGIRTEHEATSATEALEKLQKGMRILIREGSVSKDLEALQPLLDERNSAYMCLCTDDRNPLDIAEQGHLDFMIRRLIAMGTSPLAAYRVASLSAAEAFGLKDRGHIAPGKRADIVALGSLEACDAKLTICGGQIVGDAAMAARKITPPIGRHSVKAPKVIPSDFRSASNRGETDVIGVIPGKIITEHLKETIAPNDGDKAPDISRDLIKIAVIERHGINGNIATGFVKGFGMQAGAIASTVCHDHHNIACVGVDYSDMALAVNRMAEIEGGFVVAKAGQIIAELPLPIAGLMSSEPFEVVRHKLEQLRAAAAELGVVLDEPFLQLAFLALPVIPMLKITDRGMVDVGKFEIIS